MRLFLKQAVMRKARTLGVMRAVEENPHGKALLRKYYALALVPADRMEEAFEFLQVCIKNCTFLFKKTLFLLFLG